VPIDRRDCCRTVVRIAKKAGIPRHISPHSLRHAAITNALDAGVPLRDAQILARHADPRATEHYDRACGNLDSDGVHFLTAYIAGV
jgi:integrase/recombinase XerD